MSNTLCLPSKVARLIPLLGSDVDGEVVSAARAIARTLKSAGLDLHDLARQLEPTPVSNDDWRSDLHLATVSFNYLNPREQDFIAGVSASTRWREPTEKQRAWLFSIAARLMRRAAA